MGMTVLTMALFALPALLAYPCLADADDAEKTDTPACALVPPTHVAPPTPQTLLYLERCQRHEPSSERKRRLVALRKTLGEQGYAPIALALSPDTATAEMPKSFPEDTLRNDDELWLEQGNYNVLVHSPGYQSATFSIEVDAGVQMVVPLHLEKLKEPKNTTIDIGQEPGSSLGEVSHSADLRDKEFETLLADKYQRAPDPVIAAPVKHDSPSYLWPTVTAIASVGALATGLVLQKNDRLELALASYGVSAILGGGAIYLYFQRTPDARNNSQSEKIPVVDGALLGYQFAW